MTSTTVRLRTFEPTSSDAGSATVEKAEMMTSGRAAWSLKFKTDVRHYDDTTNPWDFLQLYSLAATVAGADEMIMTS